jgi:hypothetical protein
MVQQNSQENTQKLNVSEEDIIACLVSMCHFILEADVSEPVPIRHESSNSADKEEQVER